VKKLTLTLVAAALAVGMTSAAMAQRIVVVVHGTADDPFWSVVKNGVDAAATDMGITVDYHAGASGVFDVVAMGQVIDAAIATNPDGLAVSLPDADALGQSIRDAVAAGIPVVSLNSGSDDFKSLGVLAHVGQTEYVAGVGGGERMKALGVTNALCFNQEVGNVALDRRCAGFAEGLGEGSEVTILAGTKDPTESRNAILAALNINPDLNGVLALGPTGADPALQALEEADKLGDIVFATFDLSPTVLEALRDGKMAFAIDQQQFLQGYLPIVMLTQFHKYGVIPANVVLTGPGFVTQDNAAQVIDLSKQGIR